MAKAIRYLLIILLVLPGQICRCQTRITVSDPRIELEGNVVHIYYDILHSQPSDQFTISIEITDEDGERINARALEGDIGDKVDGGRNRHITWDLEADQIFLHANIFFEIYATPIQPPEPESLETESNLPDEGTGKEITKHTETETYNRAALILQSVAVPGLGLSRVTGKPHWLRAVAGYGCIAGSVIFTTQARSNYNSLDKHPDFEDKRELYETSIRQDNVSEVLAYAAVGIWVADILWTWIGTSDLNRGSLSADMKGISVGGALDPLTFIPAVRIRYTF